MELQKIITLANKDVAPQFRAMERSLRETGCTLPVWVIPYDESRFNLPENCVWWEMPDICAWIERNDMWPAMRKIQCLTTSHYHFVDSDVIFLQNPLTVLKPHNGFVTSCTHWNNTNHTVTEETLPFFINRSTTWQRLVFNSGQWACDQVLYESKALMQFCEQSYKETLFTKTWLYKDQAALNLLVNHTKISITNLTLPPFNMESTWAGDYLHSDPDKVIKGAQSPYLLHWAGTPILNKKYVNALFFKYLSQDEQTAFLTNLHRTKNSQSFATPLISRFIKRCFT